MMSSFTRYCFALDLVDDAVRIKEYESHHAEVWPEVRDSFRRAGIENVELYRTGNRLFMLLDVNEHFSSGSGTPSIVIVVLPKTLFPLSILQG